MVVKLRKKEGKKEEGRGRERRRVSRRKRCIYIKGFFLLN